MNLALPAIVIILIILPGMLARYFYRRGFWKSPVKFGDIQSEIFYGLLYALILHALFLSTIIYFDWYSIRLDTVVLLVSGWPQQDSFNVEPYLASIADYPIEIIGYFTLISFTGVGFGFFSHWFVRSLRWDLKYSMLKYKNHWHYIFSGEEIVIKKIKSSKVIAKQIRLSSDDTFKNYINDKFFQGKEEYKNEFKLYLKRRNKLEKEKIELSNTITNLQDKMSESLKELVSKNPTQSESPDSDQVNTLSDTIENEINSILLSTEKKIEAEFDKINDVNSKISDLKRSFFWTNLLDNAPRWYEFRKKVNRNRKIRVYCNQVEKFRNDYIKISCMEINADKVMLYFGALSNYTFKDGVLDKITLTSTFRTEVDLLDSAMNSKESDNILNNNQKNWEASLKKVEGEAFILNYSDIKNISIDHSSIEDFEFAESILM